MIRYLKLKDTGPAPLLEAEWHPRLNMITGDNGLGKTFLLDATWYALTGTWSALPAGPHLGAGKKPEILARFDGKMAEKKVEATWRPKEMAWKAGPGGPPIPGLIVYARADGGFSVWDPERNYGSEKQLKAFHFDVNTLWNGLREENQTFCNGLVADWANWQRSQNASFQMLERVLMKLSPSEHEQLSPGSLLRLPLPGDVREFPTLRSGTGEEIPVIYASSAVKRVIGLCYVLVWAWYEHQLACNWAGKEVTQDVILLVDEVESHLHPKWQRGVVPALLETVHALTGQARVQIIAATHSPLILASIEPFFDPALDKAFHLDLENKQVSLTDMVWTQQGDATGWLISETFGLKQARSLQAERAIEAANQWMLEGKTQFSELASREAIHQELCRVLASHDPFWPRWIVSKDQR